ncbi:type II secretion system F family protein [Infirmifilum lucidum]|uniref:Type II secretion system F family protein n=1 Tax=Infirmifilum lucidum TaxID=2776706 RepID=A0A7L9FKT4_9CREN|nr:type II secretion system F family protein [Infirmifilum lucidum]QOJ79554.1 type II secretion system F family protein [Infirmifilum lucidum]
MPYLQLDSRRLFLLFSLGLALASIPVLLVLTGLRGELLSSLKVVGGALVIVTSTRVNVLLLASIVLLFLPYAVVDSLNRLYVARITQVLPHFFKSLAEAVRSGLTFHGALRSVTETMPGSLSAEVKRALVHVELGEPLGQALRRIPERIRDANVEKAVTILITANESGGRVIDVLESAAEIFAALRSYDEEKSTTINPHVITVYASTIIYLVLALTILYVFVIPLGAIQRTGGFFGALDPRLYETIMLYSGAMTAFSGGLIAGKLKHGRASAGLIHSALQLSIVSAGFLLAEAYLTPLTLMKP